MSHLSNKHHTCLVWCAFYRSGRFFPCFLAYLVISCRKADILFGVKSESESLSRVELLVTIWTVAHQASLSTGFPRQEYWSGLPFPSPGDLPHPGTEPGSTILQADFLLTEPPGLFVWGIRSKIGKGVVRVIYLGVGLYLSTGCCSCQCQSHRLPLLSLSSLLILCVPKYCSCSKTLHLHTFKM